MLSFKTIPLVESIPFFYRLVFGILICLLFEDLSVKFAIFWNHIRAVYKVLREEEADKLERRWESIYGKKGKARRIAVLGKGTSFEPLTMTPAALKFFDLKRWNLYTILAKYGIPPMVAHVQDVRS